MSPLMRTFTLVGMALAAASMQLKARAEPAPGSAAQPLAIAQADETAGITRHTD